MKASYISYFEGCNATGHVVFAGNGAATVEYDDCDCVDPGGFLNSHSAELLKVAQAKNPGVVVVYVKNIVRL
ncbi:hypothetical protein [Kluyvera ascorbata]|uniref:hypothetical protein n=1 Tax=Kluyvera ascorbata TaxID=51288 RepID=UPI002900FC40|nr:hypothetical protein [Kluyvera ascorbata]MDU1198741.1 hypothetical protein [Kluyvera ascorbata]